VDFTSRLAHCGPAGLEPVALVVYGLRADFYAHCAAYHQLRTALQDGQVVVGPMSSDELREAIVNPAERAGLQVEPGLADLLLRDLGSTFDNVGDDHTGKYEAGRLPLLAHALRATWRERHGHTLTVDGYRLTGGIQHAVANTAERTFTALNSEEQRIAASVFLRLVKIGEGADDTRRRVTRVELIDGSSADQRKVQAVLSEFTRNRLLTQHRHTVEITHEVLLRAWPRLRQWIDADRATNLIRQQLDEAAAAWDNAGRDTGLLFRGSRLDAARSWATEHKPEMGPRASAFLKASTRRRRLLASVGYTLASLVGVLALVASAAAVVAFQQRDSATASLISAQADRFRESDSTAAAQMDVAAFRKRPGDQNLRMKLTSEQNTPLDQSLTGHVESVAFSPDGHTLASAGSDTLQLWNVANPTQPRMLGKITPPDGTSGVVAFSPNGHILATGNVLGSMQLWNVSDPNHPAPLSPPLTGGVTTSIAFSPDGRTLASGGNEGLLRLWNVTDPSHTVPLGQPLPLGQPIKGAGGKTSVAFSPDSRTLADSSNVGKEVWLWNVSEPNHPKPLGQPLSGHTHEVESVAFRGPCRMILGCGSVRTELITFAS